VEEDRLAISSTLGDVCSLPFENTNWTMIVTRLAGLSSRWSWWSTSVKRQIYTLSSSGHKSVRILYPLPFYISKSYHLPTYGDVCIKLLKIFIDKRISIIYWLWKRYLWLQITAECSSQNVIVSVINPFSSLKMNCPQYAITENKHGSEKYF